MKMVANGYKAVESDDIPNEEENSMIEVVVVSKDWYKVSL